MVYAVIPTEYTDQLVPVTYQYQPNCQYTDGVQHYKICIDQNLQGPTYVLIHHDSHHSDHGGHPPPSYEANKAVDENQTN